MLPTLARLFEKMNEGMMIIDANWRILFANDFARRYLSLTPTDDKLSEELIPKMSGQLILGEDFADMTPHGPDEGSIAFEASSIPEMSLPFTLSVYVSRPNEEGIRFVLLRDVTKERNEERWKGRLLSLISHKLMTPINSVKMAIGSILDEVAGPVVVRQRELLNVAINKLRLLESSVRRLIEYALFQETAKREPIEEIDAVVVVQEFCPRYASQQEKQVKIDVRSGIETAMVKMPEKFFVGALECILENAIKFHDGPLVNIEISFRRDPATQELEIAIKDDGPGIPPAIQIDIFSAFVQRDDDGAGNVEGMGLGLPYVKGLMGLLGGRISLESKVGHGTTIRLFFPRP